MLILLLAGTCGCLQGQQLLQQPVKVRFKNARVKTILKTLDRKQNIPFSYSDDILPSKPRIDLVYEGRLKGLMDTLSWMSGLDYKILNDQILIKKSNRPAHAPPKTPFSKLKYTISGFIKDEESGEALIAATVIDMHSGMGTMSNDYGFFTLSLPSDSVALRVSYVGFQPELHSFELRKDTSLEMNLPYQAELEDVEIIAEESEPVELQSQMSSVKLQSKLVKKLPALAGEADLMRALQLTPGVSFGSEGSTGLYVRGGGPDQNLILLDGVPVYNANHLFGFFSVFNPDAVNSIELIKGGFPARYGGRLSSVIDIRMKEGNLKKFSAEGSIGLIAAKATIEGPIIKDKTSFLITARRTYLDLLIRPLLGVVSDQTGINSPTGYHFFDLTAKINHKFSNNDRIYISYYGGTDRGFIDSEQTSQNGPRVNISRTNGLIKWGNTTAAFRWNHLFGPKMFSNTTLTFSKYEFRLGNEIQETIFEDNQLQEDRLYVNDYISNIQDLAFKFDVDYRPNPSNTIRFGINSTFHTFQPGAVAFRQSNQNTTVVDSTLGATRIRANEVALYIEDEFRAGKRFGGNVGLHASTFTVREREYGALQPRLTLRYLIRERLSVKASFVTMTQYLHLLSNTGLGLPTDLWVPATDKVPPQQASQAAIGLFQSFPKGYDASIEAYYKSLDQVIAYQDGATYLNTTEVWENKVEVGSGETYGVEFLFRKNSGNTTGWIGYTLSWAWRQFPGINNGVRFPYRYDRRHDIAITIQQRLNPRWELYANWVFTSGNPITLPQGVAYTPYTGQVPGFIGNWPFQAIDYGSRNAVRMEAYHRLDVGFSYTKRYTNWESKWQAGAYNAYNRFNPYFIGLAFDEAENQVIFQKFSLFPIIPSFNWSFKF